MSINFIGIYDKIKLNIKKIAFYYFILHGDQSGRYVYVASVAGGISLAVIEKGIYDTYFGTNRAKMGSFLLTF